jgi:uncharacterized membrane protein
MSFKAKILLISILVFAFFIPFSGDAAEKSWYFKKWDVMIDINEDSSFVVKEAQTISFSGDFSWVTRDLPKTKGIKYTDIHVYNENMTELTGDAVEITDTSSSVKIKLNFSLSNKDKTWIFQYKVLAGIGFFETWDELYWNAVSSDRSVPIDQIQVTVTLPEKIDAQEIQQKIYLGPTGSTDESQDYTAGEQELNFFGKNIPPYENFTIVAGWPKGVVEEPGYWSVDSKPQKADIFVDNKNSNQKTPYEFVVPTDIAEGKHEITLKKTGYEDYQTEIDLKKGETKELSYNLTEKFWHKVFAWIIKFLTYLFFISPLFVLILLFIRWEKHGKDPKGKTTIIPQYDPPDKVEPAVMGVLIDEKADLRDITSTIIDLAYRGYLKIIEKEEKGILSKSKKYTFKKMKNFYNDNNLKEYEKLILTGIFAEREEVELDDLKNEFYKNLKDIKKSLYEETTKAGYFEDNPDRVRNKYVLPGIILLSVGWILVIMPAIWGLLLIIFGIFMPRKTEKGVEAKWWANGFKMYLYTAERFRLGKVTPETFEKFLSYAMVFQVEKQWAERFKDIYLKPPDWYVGPAGYYAAFSVINFTSHLSTSFNTALTQGLVSSPSSSSGFGSGFGGGFAGGGGGGGGSGAG